MKFLNNTAKTFSLICVLLASTSYAFFDNRANAAGETKYNAKRIMACHLVKTSYKGENEGFFSSAEKSVEASCQDRDGELMEFSATMAQWETLRNHAGHAVLVYLSDRKIKNAKTDWTLVEAQNIEQKSFTPKKLCGPAQDKQLLQGEKVWSRGFRIAWVYDASRAKESDTWNLHAYVGFNGDTKWAEKGSVTFGEFCGKSIHKIMETNEALIFTYVQKEEDPDYLVEAVYRMVWQ